MDCKLPLNASGDVRCPFMLFDLCVCVCLTSRVTGANLASRVWFVMNFPEMKGTFAPTPITRYFGDHLLEPCVCVCVCFFSLWPRDEDVVMGTEREGDWIVMFIALIWPSPRKLPWLGGKHTHTRIQIYIYLYIYR